MGQDIFFASVLGAESGKGIIEISRRTAFADSGGKFFACKAPQRSDEYISAGDIGKPNRFRGIGWTVDEAEKSLRLGLRSHADALEKGAAEFRRCSELEAVVSPV